MIDNAKPLLSVIVTVYGTEAYLPKCIESVLNSTYSSIELVIVDNHSPGNVKEIVTSYMEQDSRIKFVENKVDQGLYHARITGVENSHGEYLAFLDSDDHVSVDFYRRLIEKSLATDSDMVIGEFCFERAGHFSKHNLMHTRITNIDVSGDDTAKLLFRQHGRDYSLHLVWNKVYRHDLWNRALPYLKLQDKYLIMCEDVMYSSVLFYCAHHITNIHGDFVYYYKREDSSTGRDDNYTKYENNIKDIKHVFQTLSYIFKEKFQNETYLPSLKKWEELLERAWVRNIKCSSLPSWQKNKLENLVQYKGNIDPFDPSDDFFYSVITDQGKLGFEQLKEQINTSQTKIVSFDIFDTLVYRPFWQPSDLFVLLGIYVGKLISSKDQLDFPVIRKEAENKARMHQKEIHPQWEDITLNDIYAEIQRYLGIDDKTTEKIKQKEIDLELKYCHPRTYAKELFEMALAIGKKVIITSDMYLPKDVIEKILVNCGYEGYSAIYVSSEAKRTKATGNLYEYITKAQKTSGKEILHIGDTMESDVEMAKKKGWQSGYFPKAVDRFRNIVPNFYGGQSIQRIFEGPFAMRDAYQHLRYFGTRTLLAVAANKIFANPFVTFHPDTDFNADPNVVGYYALGMHLFAIAQWLAKEMKQGRYTNLNFMARDGKLPMKAFQVLDKVYNCGVKTNYLYLTRAVMFPLQVEHTYDLFGIPKNANVFSLTPKKIFDKLEAIFTDQMLAHQEEFCQKQGFLYEGKFTSVSEFYEFIVSLQQEKCVDPQKLREYVEKVGEYLADAFDGKSATFDIGYSCRVESILKSTYGYDVTPYYIHINNDTPNYRAQKNDITVHTFYDYSPGVTGAVRELFISAMEPSCKALEINNGKVVPVFKTFSMNYMERYVISHIQESALQYVNDVVKLFGEDVKYLYYQREDVSLPLEYFLEAAKKTDRQLMACSGFEDELTLGSHVRVADYWNGLIENVAAGLGGGVNDNDNDMSLYRVSKKWQRAICLYFINRDYLKYKVKIRLASHPVLLSAIKSGYKGVRSVYRFIHR